MRTLRKKTFRRVVLLCLAATTCCRAQEQYPKPLVHTLTDHPAARVLLLSIDGMHAVDLATWVAEHPHSTLAELSRRGVTYTNAHTPLGDPAVGLLSLTTGGSPISTGIISSDGYDRSLSPAGSNCAVKGTPVKFAAMFRADGKFDPSAVVLNASRNCKPAEPHELLRVNTMFEVVREKIGPTAWAGDSAWETDLLRGPSGYGVDDGCASETSTAREGDAARVGVVLSWIDGKACSGATGGVPVLFGMTFDSVAAAQADADTGYVDALPTTSPGLAAAFAFVDSAIGRLVGELKARQLYATTWIALSSSYGSSPMNLHGRRVIPIATLRAAVDAVQPGLAAHVNGGGTAMIWLSDSGKTSMVAKAINEGAEKLGVEDIYSGARLGLIFNTASKDSRMPDIILQGQRGVVWGASPNAASFVHGGMLDENTHVALLISGAQLTGRSDPTYVPTTQLAPLLLRALGMEKFDLQALHLEHSPALPGIF